MHLSEGLTGAGVASTVAECHGCWLVGLSSSACGSLHRDARTVSQHISWLLTEQGIQERAKQPSSDRPGRHGFTTGQKTQPVKEKSRPKKQTTCSLVTYLYVSGIGDTMMKKETHGSYFLTFEGGRQASNQAMKTQCEEGPPWWTSG